MRHQPTAEESDKHKATKERIARAADRHGLTAQPEARTPDGKVRNDVLVTGAVGRIGWEAQYSPITAGTVRRRSQAAVDHGIFPVWLTNSDRAALIDRAPWVQVDDIPWTVIASPQAMLVRAGVRHLQRWKCTRFSVRSCPVDSVPCGRFHALWELPALCLPPKPPTCIDQLVVTSADGEHVPMRIPHQNGARQLPHVGPSGRPRRVAQHLRTRRGRRNPGQRSRRRRTHLHRGTTGHKMPLRRRDHGLQRPPTTPQHHRRQRVAHLR